jgi:RHS repeat-associated protein
MSSDGTFNYQYDADGNLITRTEISNTYSTDYKTVYTWDYRNRLTDVEDYNNNGVLTEHVHYTYDVFNDLIATQVDPTGSGTYTITQRYVDEGGQPVLEFDNNGNLIQRNLVALDAVGVDSVMAQEAVSSLNQAGVVTWMLDDNLGSARDEVNNNSTVVNHIVYTAFGQDVYESDPSYTHWNGFGGGHQDNETGLTLDGRRWYDPATGKWLSQDPTGFGGQDADLSRYADNSPTNAIDPNGTEASSSYTPYIVMALCPWTAFAFAAGAAFGPQPLNGGPMQAPQGPGGAAAMAQAQQAAAQHMMAQQQQMNANQQLLAAQQAQMQQAAANMMAQQQMNAQAQQMAALQPPMQQPPLQQAPAQQGPLLGALAPNPAPNVGPLPGAAPGGQFDGMIGGGVAGGCIGAMSGGAGALVGGTIIVIGAVVVGATVPAWGTVALAVGAGMTAGAVLGAILGAVEGANQVNGGQGALAAWDSPWVWGMPFVVGLGVGSFGTLDPTILM